MKGSRNFLAISILTNKQHLITNIFITGQKPTASYNPLSNRIRQAIPEEQLCSMFCGGKKCKYCDPPSQFDKGLMAIDGLYSAW